MVRATWDRWDEAGPDRSPGRSSHRRRGKAGSSLLVALSQRFDLRAYFTRIQSVAEILLGRKWRSPLEARDCKATQLNACLTGTSESISSLRKAPYGRGGQIERRKRK